MQPEEAPATPVTLKQSVTNRLTVEASHLAIIDATNDPAKRDNIMQFFTYAHLPPHLRDVSEPFAHLAESIHSTLPRNPERTVALRKMLEAKDAAVRCLVAKA